LPSAGDRPGLRAVFNCVLIVISSIFPTQVNIFKLLRLGSFVNIP
jgi:hypothetical protein